MKLVKCFSVVLLVQCFLLTDSSVFADTITTSDGSLLKGQITVITPANVSIETEYAGTVTIDAGKISRLETRAPISTKLEDGTIVTGITTINSDGIIVIENETMKMEATVEKLMASWIPENKPPTEAGFPRERRWVYSVAADFTGKRGNSRENGLSSRAEAKLVSDNDELNFYLSVDRADNNGQDTSNEIIFGSSYVSYFSRVVGWYVSSELERDPFESINLRASVSAGLSYWLFNRPDFSLELQSGLGYRHEAFDDGTTEDVPTLDLRVHNHWQVNSWMDMTNTLSFRPSLSNLGDYLLFQDSGIIMPISSSRWSLRLGLENNYANEPAVGRKKLDTTYYSRLLMNFE